MCWAVYTCARTVLCSHMCAGGSRICRVRPGQCAMRCRHLEVIMEVISPSMLVGGVVVWWWWLVGGGAGGGAGGAVWCGGVCGR